MVEGTGAANLLLVKQAVFLGSGPLSQTAIIIPEETDQIYLFLIYLFISLLPSGPQGRIHSAPSANYFSLCGLGLRDRDWLSVTQSASMAEGRVEPGLLCL